MGYGDIKRGVVGPFYGITMTIAIECTMGRLQAKAGVTTSPRRSCRRQTHPRSSPTSLMKPLLKIVLTGLILLCGTSVLADTPSECPFVNTQTGLKCIGVVMPDGYTPSGAEKFRCSNGHRWAVLESPSYRPTQPSVGVGSGSSPSECPFVDSSTGLPCLGIPMPNGSSVAGNKWRCSKGHSWVQ